MSLETTYQTQIRIPRTQIAKETANLRETPCFEILTLAMEKVARDRGGVVDTTWTNNEGVRNACLLSVRTGDFSRGVGARVEPDGRLTFVWDAYGDSPGLGERIAGEITQNYAVIAVMRVQKKHGFRVSVTEQKIRGGTKRVVVKGVA